MTPISAANILGLFNLPVPLPFLLDEIPLGLAVLDAERRIVLVNRALEGLTGFVQQEAEGIPCSYILRNKNCFDNCPFLQMRAASEPVVQEGDIINRDRQKIPVRVTFAPLRNAEGKVVGYLEAVEDVRALRAMDSSNRKPYSFGHLVGKSPQMERLFQVLPIIAQSDSSVLITGETGTGKDFVAEAIHQASPRARDAFIKVNCGALPETLLESELFGHQKGAFTGAVENKPGRFRLAHNGTLYLTEIGDLPLSLQVKILTFLDDKVVYPLGSTKGFQVNVRVIAATHRNLERMVHEGRFREDLLFRLNVVRLQLPALRERGDDIRLLLDHFLHTYVSQFQKPVQGFSPKALQVLLDYSYPGNVRELKNIVEYALNICQEDLILPKHLPAYLTESRPPYGEPAREEPSPSVLAVPVGDREESLDWAAMERKMILEAMVKAKGRRSKAAELLGWGRSTLWRKMKQYGMDS
ncbi:sigma-54-dependent Fis family transcriptional regulator [Desulforhabdus sp. TSK]|uniref:sigma-54 interaction domain-containing protein n=1 Tax=Desulforhabdus sp. TSK TaxID=2925014 RepID=UPI001FC88849|nr:sigma 54-interacting transcriptional regulator [Desulforhabdus sp. TSK]GKT08860.1 sigma-54-dependent Fis family transcriptional regulator [Desulforhabdus sp. TSK]